MKTTLKKVPADIEGEKRQYAPYVLDWTCTCGKQNSFDFRGDYLSYPTFGKAEPFTLWCRECQVEHQIQVKLDLVLEVLDTASAGSAGAVKEDT